ncbi:hypothetical protein CJ030_MR6G011333 [Morella rubra]|uniref:FBD domain-containing protein n=1 Tax=Morella rubra TaxID=262757 RepID=A0A6A1VBN2_9ROSI|nr:hypothetical protein CJ030_MR6G011333 [Morella rubra]
MGSAEIEDGAVSFLSGVSSAHECLLYCLLLSGDLMDSCSSLSLVQILSAVYCKGGLPYSFTNLRTLEIHTSLSKREIPGILCLLRKSPVLDTLKFQIFHGKEDNVKESTAVIAS